MSAQRITLRSSASANADGNGDSFLVSTAREAAMFVNITVDDFTDLDVWLEASNDDGTTWFGVPNDGGVDSTGAIFAARRNVVDAASATGKWCGLFKAFPYKHVRVAWDFVTGTSGTFSVVLDVK